MLICGLFLNVEANESCKSQILFTGTDKNWLQNHPVIRVANEIDWPLFDFNESGKPKGFAIDYVKLLAKKIGVKIEFVRGYAWTELIARFRRKEIDVMPVVAIASRQRKN